MLPEGLCKRGGDLVTLHKEDCAVCTITKSSVRGIIVICGYAGAKALAGVQHLKN